MVVAEVDSGGAVTRYAYISNITSTTIVYGTSATDTSDGVALNTSNNIAVFVPIEPGHTIRVKNKVWAKDYDVLVQKVNYDVQPGIINATIEGVGLDTNEAGVTGVPPSIVDSKVSASTDKGYAVNIPKGQQKWSISDGTIRAKDHNTIEVVSNALATSGQYNDGTGGGLKTYVTLITADGKRYHVSTGDVDLPSSGDTDARIHPHVLYFRSDSNQSGSSSNMLAKAKSSDASNPSATEIYSKISHRDDIIIGWAKADTDQTSVGRAILHLSGDLFGSPGQIDVSAIANNHISSALMKKGAQPFATDVRFKEYPSGTSSVYNKIQWEAGNISFGEGTDGIAINAGNSDQDFTSVGGVNISSGMSANTTYYVYYIAGGSTLAITDNYLVPFQDDRVLLATVVTESNPSATNYSPTILPYNGKQPTVNAASIAANSVIADSINVNNLAAISADMGSINAGTITGGVIRTGAITRSGTAGTNAQLSGAGILIDNAGIYGASGSGTANLQFDIAASDGKIRFGAGAGKVDMDGLTLASISTATPSSGTLQAGKAVLDAVSYTHLPLPTTPYV